MYSPAISPKLIRKLYKLKMKIKEETGTNLPMTYMVNSAVKKYLQESTKKSN